MGRAQARRIEDTLFEESAIVFALLNEGVSCQVEGKTYQEIGRSSDHLGFLLELRRNLPVYQFSSKRKKITHFRKISKQYFCILQQKQNLKDGKIITIKMHQRGGD